MNRLARVARTGGEVATEKKPRKRLHLPRLTRDVIIFTVGLLGIIHEAVIQHTERPFLLALFGAMIGLPAFLRKDEKGDE
jgi:hypothetical protein